MGHEVVNVDERVAILKDDILWSLGQFMLGVSREAGLHHASKHLNTWEWYGPGVIGGLHDLEDALLAQSELRDELLQAIALVGKRFQSYGGLIPKSVLNSQVIHHDLVQWLQDPPVSIFNDSLEKLAEVLAYRNGQTDAKPH